VQGPSSQPWPRDWEAKATCVGIVTPEQEPRPGLQQQGRVLIPEKGQTWPGFHRAVGLSCSFLFCLLLFVCLFVLALLEFKLRAAHSK
jgi:hypothetical protein